MALGAGGMRWVAELQKHSGRLDNGEPTYSVERDWQPVLRHLPVEWKEVSGGEVVRGRQMEANTTSLLRTHWSPETRAIEPKKYRLKIGSRILNVVSAIDPTGSNREILIQTSEVR
jgi:hypothetical protein